MEKEKRNLATFDGVSGWIPTQEGHIRAAVREDGVGMVSRSHDEKYEFSLLDGKENWEKCKLENLFFS